MSNPLMQRDRTALLVVDVQEGFRSYDTFAEVARQCGRLVQGAEILDLPIIATEQYPKGLEHTAAEVGLPDGAARIEKSVFSAARADGFDLGARDQVLVVEAALLELCERAGTPEFKAVQKVIL